MQIINLYKYNNTDGTVTVSPNKRNDNDVPTRYRLIADDGKTLVNGDVETQCVDVLTSDGWTEVIDSQAEYDSIIESED